MKMTGVRSSSLTTSSVAPAMLPIFVCAQRGELLDGGIDVPVGFPVRVEVGRLGRDPDVVDELRDHFCVPELVDEGFGGNRIQLGMLL